MRTLFLIAALAATPALAEAPAEMPAEVPAGGVPAASAAPGTSAAPALPQAPDAPAPAASPFAGESPLPAASPVEDAVPAPDNAPAPAERPGDLAAAAAGHEVIPEAPVPVPAHRVDRSALPVERPRPAELEALRSEVAKHFEYSAQPGAQPGAETGEADAELSVTLRVRLTEDGALAKGPEMVEAAGGTSATGDAQRTALAEAGQRALLGALNAGAFAALPRERFAAWEVMDFTFTPEGVGYQ